jgi:hypothetical protein
MPHKIFFSWQVDTPSKGGRNFIERALERAASQVEKDIAVEDAVREELTIDRDTKNVAGSPPIVETIFKKIDQAAIFVPDLTFVGKRLDGRPTPNPNVLIEYGWALKSLGHGRIVPIMNTAYGAPSGESMPFDMRHLRNPITYDCAEVSADQARSEVRQRLAQELEAAIRLVFGSDDFKQAQPLPPPYNELPSAPESLGRFAPASEPIGIRSDFGGHKVIHLAPGPICWFRLMPTTAIASSLDVDTLEQAMKNPFLVPLSRDWPGYDLLRHPQGGYGIYSVQSGERERALAIVVAFTRGEVWSIDTGWLAGSNTVPNVETSYRRALSDYGQFLMKLGIKPPYRWIAGMDRLKGRALYVPAPPGFMRALPHPNGQCLLQMVTESGIYSPGDATAPALKPFFVKLYEACGVSRESWQDNP